MIGSLLYSTATSRFYIAVATRLISFTMSLAAYSGALVSQFLAACKSQGECCRRRVAYWDSIPARESFRDKRVQECPARAAMVSVARRRAYSFIFAITQFPCGHRVSVSASLSCGQLSI
jgi:hypothetical protein